MFSTTLFHPYSFQPLCKTKRERNTSLLALIAIFSPFSPIFLPLLTRKQRQSTSFFCNFPERPVQRRYCTHSFPTFSSLPPFGLANSDVVGILLVFKLHVVEEDVALNYHIFSLCALSLFRPNPDSLDTFNFDAAEPPYTPPPLSFLRRHTSRFHHLSSPQSLPSLSQDDAFTLTASGKTMQSDWSAAPPRASTTGRRSRPSQLLAVNYNMTLTPCERSSVPVC
jgi:hypothetical protein